MFVDDWHDRFRTWLHGKPKHDVDQAVRDKSHELGNKVSALRGKLERITRNDQVLELLVKTMSEE